MLFLDGDVEYARTLPLSLETARYLAHVAIDWPLGGVRKMDQAALYVGRSPEGQVSLKLGQAWRR